MTKQTKKEFNKLFIVNGKPINFVIGQYVERKDVGGLAEFFRAFLIDLSLIIKNTNKYDKTRN